MIDTFSKDWIEWLDRQSTQLLDGEEVFLLIDGVFLPGLWRDLAKASGNELVLLFEYLPGCSSDTRDVSPILLAYHSESQPLHRILEKCDGMPMISAIITTESLQDLATRLAPWCVVEADGQRFNFRFPDTRRLPDILTTLTEEQRASLTGPASSWHYIARDGSWRTASMQPTPVPSSASFPRLTASQFCALVDSGEADVVLSIFADRGVFQSHSHSVLHTTVSQALSIAAQAKLADWQRVDWCEACVADASLVGPEATKTFQSWLDQRMSA